jgi:hypothetical protein
MLDVQNKLGSVAVIEKKASFNEVRSDSYKPQYAGTGMLRSPHPTRGLRVSRHAEHLQSINFDLSTWC